MQVVSVFLSAFTMLAISLDRYRAVIFPLQPRLTHRIAGLIIAITWALAMLASLPVAIFSRVSLGPDRDGVMRDLCLEDWPYGRSQRYAYSMAVTVLQYFLPLAILSFTYANIGVVIWVKKAPGEAENTRDQRLAASKRKVFRKCMFLHLSFLLSVRFFIHAKHFFVPLLEIYCVEGKYWSNHLPQCSVEFDVTDHHMGE